MKGLSTDFIYMRYGWKLQWMVKLKKYITVECT